MPRIVKEYDERYQEFLGVGQQLFHQQGYENVSVRQIIDAVGVAKGTFYHYFDSKDELLDAVVEHGLAGAVEGLQPIVDDPAMGAIEKYQAIYTQLGMWKTARKDMMLAALRMMYRKENILLRTKMFEATFDLMIPVFARVIEQGVEEGVFDATSPEMTAEIVLHLGRNMSSSMADRMLSTDDWSQIMEPMTTMLDAYQRSIERILGAPKNSIDLVPQSLLEEWFR